MTIKLNDREHEVPEGISVAGLVESIGLRPEGMAVAIGVQVVPRERWAGTVLAEGAEVILIHAVSGG